MVVQARHKANLRTEEHARDYRKLVSYLSCVHYLGFVHKCLHLDVSNVLVDSEGVANGSVYLEDHLAAQRIDVGTFFRKVCQSDYSILSVD